MVGVPQVDDGLQFLGFFDYAFERQETSLPADGSNPNVTLYSVGGGLRYTIRKNLSVRFDYGFPLTQQSLNEHQSRGHVGVLLSF
jgi:hemolysin activation/secretion protein